MSVERDRRRGSPGPMRGPPRGGGRGMPDRGGYKVLCVSSLHPKASDDVVRDTLYREYKKYGDISVRVMHEPDERVAYVYFRNFDDARDAKHSKSRIILFDKPAIVEAVYESASREEYHSMSNDGDGGRGGGRGRPRSLTPPRFDDIGGRGRGGRGDGPRGDYGRPRSPERFHDGGYRDDYRRGPPRGPRDDFRGPPPRDLRDEFRGPPRGRGRGGFDRGPPQYHHDGPGGGGGRGGRDNYRDNRKDKFPNYLNHLPPEEDPLATRTLFAGNLELNITEEEMRRIFGRYGELVDIDIKRPPPGTGNAYAFIRFANLDQSAMAKRELSGQYIGKFQCKIGYGKVNATTKVWIGGLSSWASLALIEREFDRFGAITKIDYEKGNDHGFVQYETMDAASAAVQEMRGFPLGGPDKRIRMDFADVEDMPPPRGYQGSDYDANYRGGRGRGFRGGGRGGAYFGQRGNDDWGKRPGDDLDGPPSRMRRVDARTPEHGESISPARGRGDGAAAAKSITDLSKRLEKSWEGGLILKNSMFPTRFLLTEGDVDVVDQLMKDENDKPYMKITQRLRLDQAKLDDVSKRISSSTSHAIFLALAASSTAVPVTEGQEVQSRPLRNLVSYLKQKEAAGVISLHNRETDTSGVLYCFPPCAFSTDLLRRVAANLTDEGAKDDHLVVVVVRGGQIISN